MSHAPTNLTYTEAWHEPNQFSILASYKWLMAIQYNGEQMPEAQRENVRRLVACWNACESIPTETLEEHALGVIGAEHSQQTYRTKHERDSLMTAAKAWLDDAVDDGSFADTLRQIIARSTP